VEKRFFPPRRCVSAESEHRSVPRRVARFTLGQGHGTPTDSLKKTCEVRLFWYVVLMAKATQKSPEIETFLNQSLGLDRTATIAADVCVSCGGDATHFRDPLSRREYSISGLCQKCQDGVFGREDDDL